MKLKELKNFSKQFLMKAMIDRSLNRKKKNKINAKLF
jgi:hypothetical protein